MGEDIQLDDLRDLSPIPMPKSYQKAPAPHPYPVKTNPKMTLAQLRKYSLPSTESTSSSCTLPTSQSESPSPKRISPVKKQTMKSQTKSRPVRALPKDRLKQLLRIQSGNYKKEKHVKKEVTNERKNMQRSSTVGHLNRNDDHKQMRRVQSEKRILEEDHFIDSDDDIDRLSQFESLNLGLSFPDTDDGISDQEEEMLLIQHLNILPN